MTPHKNLAVALSTASHGWQVFPCRAHPLTLPGGRVLKAKTPLVAGPDIDPLTGSAIEKTGGHWRATTNENQIREWWRKNPDALVGMPTGFRTQKLVVDLDLDEDKDGMKELSRFVASHGQIPSTQIVVTPRGGRHLYFRMPNRHIGNSTSKLAPGIDVRAEGGYVIASGSVMPDGREYRVSRGAGTFADIPQWLLALIDPPPLQRSPIACTSANDIRSLDRWARSVLTAEAERIATCRASQEGTLNGRAYQVGRHVAAGRLPREAALSALIEAGLRMENLRPREPWRRDDVTEKVKRAFQHAAALAGRQS